MYQFNSLLAQLGKKVAWEMQLAGLPAGVKPDMEFHPMTPTPGRYESRKQSTQAGLGSFIDKLNVFGKGGGIT